jgi:hypothetical protein
LNQWSHKEKTSYLIVNRFEKADNGPFSDFDKIDDALVADFDKIDNVPVLRF